MKVLHVSTYDGNGGAGRAAFALHRAMCDHNIDSSMLVAQKSSNDSHVRETGGNRWKAAQFADRKLWNLQKSANSSWRSPAYFGSLNADVLNASDADVINLHWVTNGFLSIKEISRITKPLVWSLYDMWVFSGAEHYGADELDPRWRGGYTKSNRLPNDRGIDIDRRTWERKHHFWTKPMHLVPASTWLADRAASSELASTWPITRIAHVVDTDVFTPMDRMSARRLHNLPAEIPLVLFLSSAGIGDPRKGWDLLAQSIERVKRQVPNIEVVVAGPSTPEYQLPCGTKIHWVGHIEGNQALRSLYATANVVAVPSREDNMPLTAMEAQSVGIPVVAFNIGGLPDIVVDNESGSLASAFVTEELASGIIRSLGKVSDGYSSTARTHAVATWSPDVVVRSYVEVYQEEIAKSQSL